MVSVVTHQGRHVEGGRKPVLPLAEQKVKSLVRIFSETEARELAHRPQPPTIHRPVYSPGVWELAGIAERVVVATGYVVGRVERIEFHIRHGRKSNRTLARFPVGRLKPFFFVAHLLTMTSAIFEHAARDNQALNLGRPFVNLGYLRVAK